MIFITIPCEAFSITEENCFQGKDVAARSRLYDSYPRHSIHTVFARMA